VTDSFNTTNQTARSANAEISRLMGAVRTVVGWREHTAPGFTEPHSIERVPAVVTGNIDLRSMVIMPPASSDSIAITFKQLPVPSNSKSVPISAQLVEHSLVAKVGATIIVAALRDAAYSDRPVPGKAAGPVAFFKDAALFRTVEPAPFTNITDAAIAGGSTVNASPLPWSDADVQWSGAPNLMFSVAVTRQQFKGLGGGEFLEGCLLDSIVTGLARAADGLLLNALVASNLATFSLSAVAARNLRFGDVSAIIGTSAIGASVGQDGVLRADGVAAELTNSIAPTILGDFKKSAVAIYPEITVHFARTNVDGSMTATVLANAVPLVPDSSAFWVSGG
jgi:hypothetical protein